MARPKKSGLDYFPHDTDAMNDEKLEIMQLLYGNDGYAFYFKMLERIYRTPELMLDISDYETKIVMIKKCNVDESKFEMMLQSSLKHGLFDENLYHQFGMITSNGITKRAEIVLYKRQKMRERYINQGVAVSDAETQQKRSRNTAETPPETPQSKVKKRKEKESKEKESKEKNKTIYGEFVELLDSEFESLVKTHGEEFTKRCIETLDNYKGQSGTVYKSDYRAILNWVVGRVKEQDEKASRQKPPSLPSVAFQKPSPTNKPKIEPAQHAPPPDDEFDLDAALELAKFFDNRKPKGESDEISTTRQQLASKLD